MSGSPASTPSRYEVLRPGAKLYVESTQASAADYSTLGPGAQHYGDARATPVLTSAPARQAAWAVGDDNVLEESSTDDALGDDRVRGWRNSGTVPPSKPPLHFSAASQGWPSRKTALLLAAVSLLGVVALAVAVAAESRAQQCVSTSDFVRAMSAASDLNGTNLERLLADNPKLLATVAWLQGNMSNLVASNSALAERLIVAEARIVSLQAPNRPATVAVSPGVTVVGNSTYVFGASVFFGSPRTVPVTETGTDWTPSGVLSVNVGDNVTWTNVSLGLVEVSAENNVTAVDGGVNCTGFADVGCSQQMLVLGLRRFRSLGTGAVMTVVTGAPSDVPGSLATLDARVNNEVSRNAGRSTVQCKFLMARVLPQVDSGGSGMWVGGVLADNGKIYGIPYNSDRVLIIDPDSNTFDTTSITGVGSDLYKWYGGVLAGNGKIYGIPFFANTVLVIDPTNDVADASRLAWLGETGGYRWAGGVYDASSGKIFAVPLNAVSVLIIDPVTNATDTNAIRGLAADEQKWAGAVLARNGLIYCIPLGVRNVLIINPRINASDSTAIADTGLGWVYGAWTFGVLANNGKIYAAPYNSAAVLVIEPATNITGSVTLGGLAAFSPTTPRWTGAAVGADGTVYMFPRSADTLLAVDPTSNKTRTLALAINNAAGSAEKWAGGVAAKDGRMFGIPLSGDSAFVIQNECAGGV